MGSSPRVLNHDMKSTVSRSLQSLPTSSHAFEPGEENKVQIHLPCVICSTVLFMLYYGILASQFYGLVFQPAALLSVDRQPDWRNLALPLQWVLALCSAVDSQLAVLY